MKSTLSLTLVLAALVLAGCGSGAVPSPSSPGERSAQSTLELFAKDIQYNRPQDACRRLLGARARAAVSGPLAAAEVSSTAPSGPGADEVCANAVAIVRAYLAGGQRSATQLNGYVRSVSLAVTRRSASAAGQDGARSTLSYVRGRWYIDQ